MQDSAVSKGSGHDFKHQGGFVLKDAAQSRPLDNDLLDSLWNFFSSIRMAIALLSVSAVAILIGTVVEQNQPFEKYSGTYGLTLARILQTLGIFDLYHTWWFELLMALICVNLILSNFNRAEKIYRKYYVPTLRFDGVYFDTAPGKEIVAIHESPKIVAQKLENELLRLGYRFRRDAGTGASFYYADRGRLAIWGSFIAHIGLLLLFVGVIYGHFPGHSFERNVSLAEGETTYVPESHFSLTLKKFEAQWDQDRRPRLYRSTLEVLDDSGKAFSQAVEVNHPLHFRGVKAYQATYGPAAIVGRYVDQGGASRSFSVPYDETRMMFFPIHLANGKEWVGVLRHFVPDFAVGPNGEVGSLSKEPVNPGCYLTVVTRVDKMPPNPKSIRPVGWITENHAASLHNVKFYLDKVSLFSGFQLRKDPGVPIIYVSFLAILFGICLTFYIHHKVIRVRVSENPSGTEVIAVGARRDKEQDYTKEFEAIRAVFRKEM